MKFTLSWLKDHLETDASAREIADKLTMIGLELEALTEPGRALAPFRIARVVSAEPHPNADRLRVCRVDAGEGVVQVVCGAPNARTGLVGVFAPPGTHIPGTGVDLKPGVIRGVESNGMLLSERELRLSDAHEGIIDLPSDAPVGASFAAYAGLDDPVIDVGVTPNRPDALGVHGIARDLAAAGIGMLKPLDTAPVEGAYDSPIGVALDFSGVDPLPCPHFVGRHLRGVRNGSSPDWLQRRLTAIGLRPISALVDITNLMTIGFARPLHVFDAAKLQGAVRARLARDGETIEALDGRTYALSPDMTVIADDSGPIAIAGIIGGGKTGVSADTTEVFLEAAWFDPVRTARTGRVLGIHSDARHRFERGVDPAFTAPGAAIATRLILQLCGGEASRPVVAGAAPDRARRIRLRPSRVAALAGLDMDAERQTTILSALGFSVEAGADGLSVAPPSWRPDIHGEADLVEEIVRIEGLDRIPHQPLPRLESVTTRKLTVRQRRRFRAARLLAARGLHEAVTWSFIPAGEAMLFGGGSDRLKLDNPISADLSDMRPSLLPGLIAAARRNADRGQGDFGLFEVGQVYRGDQPEDERLEAGGLRIGWSGSRHPLQPRRHVDAFDAKADAIAVLDAAGVPESRVSVSSGAGAHYHPGRSGTITLGPKTTLARFGELHPAILDAFGLDGPVVGFEVDLDALPQPRITKTARPAQDLSVFQAVSRDFAFLVDRDVPAERIVRAARSADKGLIEEVSVFDVFEGLGEGGRSRSVAISVSLRPRDRTLTEEEIARASASIVQAVFAATGAALRG